jgi:hypothetical protein
MIGNIITNVLGKVIRPPQGDLDPCKNPASTMPTPIPLSLRIRILRGVVLTLAFIAISERYLGIGYTTCVHGRIVVVKQPFFTGVECLRK